jgi:hypothetical protein
MKDKIEKWGRGGRDSGRQQRGETRLDKDRQMAVENQGRETAGSDPVIGRAPFAARP